jgi:heme-degrading monooxygenase HmoA
MSTLPKAQPKAQPKGSIAVIFTAQRNGDDEPGYQAAAAAMSELVRAQPGYRGEVHARSAGGLGITVSYWADETSAKAWRDNPDHAAVREQGRGRWYDWYTLEVASIFRSYDWAR